MNNLDDAMLQNLRKLDVHTKSLNIVCYQLPCTVKGVFFLCVVFWENVTLLQTKKMSPCNTTTSILNMNLGGKREIETVEKKKKKCVMGTTE